MKGLLLKDWYVLRKQPRIYHFLMLFGPLASLRGDALLFYALVSPFNIFSVVAGEDKTSRWEVYCGSLPCSKAQIVSAKYLSGLILQSFYFFLLAITQALRLFIYRNLTWEAYFTLLSSIIIIFSLIHCPSQLLHFARKKWAEVLYTLIIFVIIIVGYVIWSGNDIGSIPIICFPFFCIGAAGFYALSWWLSIKLYQRQEIV